MDEFYSISYGKYPDKTDSTFPGEQIVSVDPIQLRIEPGKPAEPKVDSIQFTLVNKNPDGTELYDRSWIESQSRTVAEGASVADQLFFNISWKTGHFIGLLDNRTYGDYRETVTFTAKSLLSIISDSEKKIFKSFNFESCKLKSKVKNDDDYSTLPEGTDLEGNNLTDERLQFQSVLRTHNITVEDGDQLISLSGLTFDDDYADHRKLDEKLDTILYDAPPKNQVVNLWTARRQAFLKIGQITLLTWITERVNYFRNNDNQLYGTYTIAVRHAANGNYDVGDNNKVLERGHFFAGQDGRELKAGESYSITLIDYDINAASDNILMKKEYIFDEDPPPIMNGYEINYTDGTSTYSIGNSFISYFNTLGTLTEVFSNHLLSEFYSSTPDLFDVDQAPTDGRYAYWADLMMYGWADTKPGDAIVNLATMLNCYLFYDEQGKIVFQDRLLHDDYLPHSLPPDAFEVQLSDINPQGYPDGSNGFDSYKVNISDRIPINNVSSSDQKTVIVDSEGLRQRVSLRSTDLTVKNYRSDDLGVPNQSDDTITKIFRYSPDDPSFGGVADVVDNLDDFLPTGVGQASAFANSYEYPVEIWAIQWDMNGYPDAGIGKYFWVDWGSENRVYFIRDITHDPDQLLHKMEVQQVGVYTP